MQYGKPPELFDDHDKEQTETTVTVLSEGDKDMSREGVIIQTESKPDNATLVRLCTGKKGLQSDSKIV